MKQIQFFKNIIIRIYYIKFLKVSINKSNIFKRILLFKMNFHKFNDYFFVFKHLFQNKINIILFINNS
jgi:hypothetical protein